MSETHSKYANKAAAVWFISMICLIYAVTRDSFTGTIWDGSNNLVAGIFIIHGFSLMSACWFYAKSKGYSGFLGLFLVVFYFIGLMILLALPDKNKGPQDLDPNQKENKALLKRQKISGIVLVIIAIGVLWAACDYAGVRFPINMGEVIGRSMVATLFLGLIAACAPSFRQKLSITLLGGVTLICFSGYQSFEIYQAGANLKGNINTLVGNLGSENATEMDNTTPDYIQIINASLVTAQNNDKAFVNKVQAANLVNLISPKTLSTASLIAPSIKTLNNLRIDADYFEKEQLQNIDTTAGKLSLLKDSQGKEAYINFLKSKERRISYVNRYYNIQRGVISAAIELLGFTKSRLGTFEVTDGQLYFQTDADVDDYNKIFDELARYGELEQQLINQINTEAKATKEKLKAVL